jgi:hypothetical protein
MLCTAAADALASGCARVTSITVTAGVANFLWGTDTVTENVGDSVFVKNIAAIGFDTLVRKRSRA